MKKTIVIFISQCSRATVHVELAYAADEDLATALEEINGYTVLFKDEKGLKACKTDKFEVLKAEVSGLLKKGWVWNE